MKFKFIAALFVFALGLNAEASVYVDSNGSGSATGCNWTQVNSQQVSPGTLLTAHVLRCDQTGSAILVSMQKMNGTCDGVVAGSGLGNGYSFSGNCASWTVSKVDVCTMHNYKAASGVPSSGMNSVFPQVNQYCSACAYAVVNGSDPVTHQPNYDIYCK